MNDTRARRTRTAVAAAVALLLALSGCSAAGGSASTPSPAETIAAADVPAAVPADPAAPVPVGEWTLVFDNTIERGQSYAYRVASVTKGDAGDFADVRTQSGSANATLEDAVPYFIALDAAVISGDEVAAQSVSAFTVPDHGVSTLSVPADLRRCEPRESEAIPRSLGELQVRCIVALATGGAEPRTLTVRGSSSADDADIHEVASLALPAAN